MGNTIDKKALEQILQMDDESLGNIIRSLALAGGMREQRAEKLSMETDRIRRKLKSLSEQDIASMLDKINEEQLAELVKQLKG